MQTSFEVLFILSMIVPVAAVVVGAAVLIGTNLLNRQGRAGNAETPHHRGMHPVGH